MDFGYDARTEQLRETLLDFMDEKVYPAEPVFAEQLEALDNRWAWTRAPILAELRKQARARGLWNLFLPGGHGAGLTNVQYAPLAEITGRSAHLAPAALNCSAPDTGNMEVLAMFGTDEQKRRWLQPLLDGEIRSAFAMTEPDIASSDATNIRTRIEREDGRYVVNGRKWWATGAMNPDATIFIVMGKTDPSAERHRQQSMILVPRDTSGVTVKRGMRVLGYDDHDHGGHAEVEFDAAAVPAENLIGGEGDGFAIAQARLGPGRIHHCMRAIGVAERAIELLCARARSRVAFGRPLAEQGVIRDWIAESRVRLEQLRLLVLRTAWLMDTAGTKAAHGDIQAIKIATPRTVEWIVDKAIQVHGAGGLSQDFPLAAAFAAIRTLRIVDGPDEVHKDALARRELTRPAATGPTAGDDGSRATIPAAAPADPR
ncbi:MAG TPA: acyl-CoA dehydrogenase family protein [Pseudonocardiaceae bacterium]